MHLLEVNGSITETRKMMIPRPRRVIELPSGDALIINANGDLNKFATQLAGTPVHGPAMLCSYDEEVP